MEISVDTELRLLQGIAKSITEVKAEDEQFMKFLISQRKTAKKMMIEMAALLEKIGILYQYETKKEQLKELRLKWEENKEKKQILHERFTMILINRLEKEVIRFKTIGTLKSAKQELKGMLAEYAKIVELVTAPFLIEQLINDINLKKINEIYVVLQASLDDKIKDLDSTLINWNTAMENITNSINEINGAIDFQEQKMPLIEKIHAEQAKTYLELAQKKISKLPKNILNTNFGLELKKKVEKVVKKIDGLTNQIS